MQSVAWGPACEVHAMTFPAGAWEVPLGNDRCRGWATKKQKLWLCPQAADNPGWETEV